MNKSLIDKIIEEIKTDSFFEKFKYKRSEMAMYRNFNDAYLYIGLEHWRDYDKEELVISPIYGKHFNVLTKWFEKFSFKTLKDQRNNPNFYYSNKAFGLDETISFKYDLSDFEIKIDYLKRTLKECMTTVAKSYETLEDYYCLDIAPILKGELELPDVGADWVFIDLTLAYLVHPEKYPEFKSKMLGHIDWMHRRNEPNIKEYYDKLDEIISYMENNLTSAAALIR